MTRWSVRIGAGVFGAIVFSATLAPIVAVNSPERQFSGYVYAPPMWPHVWDAEGRWQRPFVYPLRLVDRLERRFEVDRSRPVPVRWFSNGRIASVDPNEEPWLPLGGDALGRDVGARVLLGARLSLGVALLAAAGALLIGATLGATAGFAGGRTEAIVMTLADFVIVLPAIYVVLALRAAMPLVLSTGQVFWATTAILAIAGWPFAARGVRAIVAVERRKEYAESARAAGASGSRILLRHLLPAAAGFLLVQGTLLGAGLHAGRGDALVCRPGLLGTVSQLGRAPQGRQQGSGVYRSPMAARSSSRYRSDNASFTASQQIQSG